MKYLTLFSALSVLIVIITIVFSVTRVYNNKKASNLVVYESAQLDSLNSALERMKEYSLQSEGDTISKKEYNFQLSEIKAEIEELQNNSKVNIQFASEKNFTTQAFWMKVIFSSVFCIAALYVILSQKYDDETKKWAFSVLTLIAGVWIGTIA